MELTVSLLRELLRNLLAWRSLYFSDGVDTLTTPDGFSVSIWDLEYLYEASQVLLPIRQRQAIRLCLLLNLSEQDAADVMHIDQTNPVAMYATSGLEKLIHMQRFNILPSREYIFATFRRKTAHSAHRKIHSDPTIVSIKSSFELNPYLGIEFTSGSGPAAGGLNDLLSKEPPYLAIA